MNIRNKNLAHEGLIIAYFTFLGYIAAFFNQVGIYLYYNLPLTLINIRSENILISMLYVSVTVVLVLNVFDYVAEFINYKSHLYRRISLYLISAIAVFSCILTFEFPVLFVGGMVFMLIIFAFRWFVHPKLKYKKLSYEKAVEATYKDSPKNINMFDLSLDLLNKKAGIDLTVPIYGLVFIGIISFMLGFVSARAKEYYYTSTSYSNVVFVVIEESRLLGVGYNPKLNEMDNSLYIIHADEDINSKLKLNYSHVGKLNR